MLTTDNVYDLINYASFVESLFIAISVAGLLYLRYTQPNRARPIKVNICLPIGFLIVCIFLVVLPLLDDPWLVIVDLIIIVAGIPVYFFFIYWKKKPVWVRTFLGSWDIAVQKLFLAMPTDD